MALKALGAVGSILDGDSKIVVSWAAESLCPWYYLDKSQRDSSFYGVLWVLVSWAPRSANSEANELARLGVTLSSEIVNNLM